LFSEETWFSRYKETLTAHRHQESQTSSAVNIHSLFRVPTYLDLGHITTFSVPKVYWLFHLCSFRHQHRFFDLSENSTNTNNDPSLSNHICLASQLSVSTTRPHHQKITADLPVHAVTAPLATVVPLRVIVSASQPRSCLSPKMALPGYCNHSFNLLKSESTLIQWVCSMCHSGPHWYIFECKYCKLKTCRPCTNKI
jgi:hypothetical protein